MSNTDDESHSPPAPGKARRKRQSQTKKAAEAAALTNQPLGPRFWFLIAGALLILGLCAYFDPASIMSNQSANGTWILSVFQILLAVLGKNLTAAILGLLTLLSLGWGLRSWLQGRGTKP